MKDNPVIHCLDRLNQLNAGPSNQIDDETVGLLNKLTELCNSEGSGNAAIASRNGGVEIICSICFKVQKGCEHAIVSALKALAFLLHGMMVKLVSLVSCEI